MAEEKIFEERVKRHLRGLGIYRPSDIVDEDVPRIGWFYKTWGGGMGTAGIPDIIGEVGGVMIAIELKAQHGHPLALQEINIQQLYDTGALACFLYPSGYDAWCEDFEAAINGDPTKFKEVYK